MKFDLMTLSKDKVLDSIEGSITKSEAKAYFSQEWVGSYLIYSHSEYGEGWYTKVNLNK